GRSGRGGSSSTPRRRCSRQRASTDLRGTGRSLATTTTRTRSRGSSGRSETASDLGALAVGGTRRAPVADEEREQEEPRGQSSEGRHQRTLLLLDDDGQVGPHEDRSHDRVVEAEAGDEPDDGAHHDGEDAPGDRAPAEAVPADAGELDGEGGEARHQEPPGV